MVLPHGVSEVGSTTLRAAFLQLGSSFAIPVPCLSVIYIDRVFQNTLGLFTTLSKNILSHVLSILKDEPLVCPCPSPLCRSRSCSLALCKPDGLEKNLHIYLMGCSFLSNS